MSPRCAGLFSDDCAQEHGPGAGGHQGGDGHNLGAEAGAPELGSPVQTQHPPNGCSAPSDAPGFHLGRKREPNL